MCVRARGRKGGGVASHPRVVEGTSRRRVHPRGLIAPGRRRRTSRWYRDRCRSRCRAAHRQHERRRRRPRELRMERRRSVAVRRRGVGGCGRKWMEAIGCPPTSLATPLVALRTQRSGEEPRAPPPAASPLTPPPSERTDRGRPGEGKPSIWLLAFVSPTSVSLFGEPGNGLGAACASLAFRARPRVVSDGPLPDPLRTRVCAAPAAATTLAEGHGLSEQRAPPPPPPALASSPHLLRRFADGRRDNPHSSGTAVVLRLETRGRAPNTYRGSHGRAPWCCVVLCVVLGCFFLQPLAPQPIDGCRSWSQPRPPHARYALLMARSHACHLRTIVRNR